MYHKSWYLKYVFWNNFKVFECVNEKIEDSRLNFNNPQPDISMIILRRLFVLPVEVWDF